MMRLEYLINLPLGTEYNKIFDTLYLIVEAYKKDTDDFSRTNHGLMLSSIREIKIDNKIRIFYCGAWDSFLLTICSDYKKNARMNKAMRTNPGNTYNSFYTNLILIGDEKIVILNIFKDPKFNNVKFRSYNETNLGILYDSVKSITQHFNIKADERVEQASVGY